MRNLKKGIFLVITLTAILTLLVGCKNNTVNDDEKVNDQVVQNGEMSQTNEINNEQTDVQEDVQEVNNIVEYKSLSELPVEYSIENAIDDKCVVITNDNSLHNENILQIFEDSVLESKESNIRVIMQAADEKLSIIDIVYSGDEMKVVQDDSRLAGNVNENVYYISDGYTFKNEDVILEDGNTIKMYQLINENTNDKVELFGYLIKNNSEIESD